MRAFILAGGLGTRLRSVVEDRPKALAPVGEAPFLARQIEFLRNRGIDDVVLCVGYRHRQIEEHFGDGRRWHVSIRYSVEPSPLGTAGAVKNAEPFVDGTFLLMNGDTYFDLDLDELLAAHESHLSQTRRCTATLALTEVDDPRGCGTVRVRRDGRIVDFLEKGERHSPPCLVNAGLYVVEPQLLELIPAGGKVSLERETFPAAVGTGHCLFGHRADGLFIDMGTPEGYRRLRQREGVIAS